MPDAFYLPSQIADISGLTAALSARAFQAGSRFVPLGDSITQGATDFRTAPGQPTVGIAFPTALAAVSGGALLQVSNAGKSGDRTDQALARLSTDVYAYSPQVVTVLLGTNDIGQGVALATAKGYYRQIISTLKASNITPILCTIPPRNTATAAFKANTLAWNAWLRYYALSQGCTLIDTYAALVDPTTGGYYSQQTVSLAGSPTGGTFTLTVGANTTAGIAYNATAATVQSALNGLASVGANGVYVTGPAGGPWLCANVTGIYTITASGAGLTGGTSPAASVAQGKWYTADGIHPLSPAQVAMAQGVWAQISPKFPAFIPYLTGQASAIDGTSDTLSLLPNGCFTTDANADGIADGWVNYGDTNGTYSLVTGDANIVGNWQQYAKTTGGLRVLLEKQFSTGYSVGDRLALSCRLQTSGVFAGGANVQIKAVFAGVTSGGGVSNSWNPAYQWPYDFSQSGGALVYSEATVPAGTTGITMDVILQPNSTSCSGTVKIAQLTLVNLTANGLVTP